MKKAYISLVMVMCLTLLLGACGGASTDNTTKEGEKGSTTAQFPVTVKDSIESVEIPAQPKRIITTAYPDNIIKLGVKPVGSAQVTEDSDGHYDHLAKDLQGTEFIGSYGNFNFEKMLSLEPDLFVLTTYDMDEKQFENLKKIAPVIRVDYTKLSWQEVHLIIGKAMGKEELAKKQIQEYETLLADKKPKIVEAFGGKSMLMVTFYGKTIYAWGDRDTNDVGQFFYTTLGLKPVENTKKESYEISLEGLAALKPDILLVSDSANKNDFMNTSTWKNMAVAKNKQVYIVNKDYRIKSYFPIGSTENLLELEKLFVRK